MVFFSHEIGIFSSEIPQKSHLRSEYFTCDCMAIISTIMFFCFFLQSASESAQSDIKSGKSILKFESNPDWLLRPPLIELSITNRRSESSESDPVSESDIKISGIICSIPIGRFPIVCIIIMSIRVSDVEFPSSDIKISGKIEEN